MAHKNFNELRAERLAKMNRDEERLVKGIIGLGCLYALVYLSVVSLVVFLTVKILWGLAF